MILANRWVAHRLLSSLPTCSLLRRHPPPSQDRFVNLRACAGARGFRISTGSNKELAASLDAAVSPNDTEMNKVRVQVAVVLQLYIAAISSPLVTVVLV